MNYFDTPFPPLFLVVGCQRSGTTWVQRLLDAHPQLACTGETALGPVLVPILQRFAEAYNVQQAFRNAQLDSDASGNAQTVRNLDEPELSAMLHAAFRVVLGRHAASSGKSFRELRAIGEKTPEHTLYLQLLEKAFPDLRVINVVRDPRDVIVSGYQHNLRLIGEPFRRQFASLDEYAQYTLHKHWIPYVDAARQFGAQHPGHFAEVRYEDLHRDPASALSRVWTILKTDADKDSIDRCIEAARFEKLTAGRERGHEDHRSFFRKGSVGDHRQHFTVDTHAVVEHIAGDAMRRLGYAA